MIKIAIPTNGLLVVRGDFLSDRGKTAPLDRRCALWRAKEQNLGLTAVISFGKIDVVMTYEPTATGERQILRYILQ